MDIYIGCFLGGNNPVQLYQKKKKKGSEASERNPVLQGFWETNDLGEHFC